MRFKLAFSTLLVFILSAAAAGEERDDLYFRVGAGAGISLMNNLADELERQGGEMPFPEYSISVSFGKLFPDNGITAEAAFGFSLLQGIRYRNEYESFGEDMTHYDFSILVSRVFLPDRKLFSPSLGIGIGYGRTNLIKGGGRIDSIEILGSLTSSSEVRDNMDLFFELFYVQGISEKKFTSPFLENVSSDAVLDSSGEPLTDRYGAAGIRVGVTIWLRAEDRRY